MKLNYSFKMMALVFGVIFGWTQLAFSQTDTLLVQWSDNGYTPITNALYNAVTGDTLANGDRANLNRVYKLQKGGFYWNSERIKNVGYTLRLVGEPPDPTSQTGFPAVIQMVGRSDQSYDGKILEVHGNIVLRNLYIIGARANGVQTDYQPIEIGEDNLRCVFDNCVFERTNFALTAWTAKNNDVFFTNCKFRNLIGRPSTQQWEGRGISMWTDEDSVVIENCTFFNIGMTAFQIEGGSPKYFRFNHNTVVNLGRAVNTGGWWQDAYFANCLLVNTFWHGEGFNDYNLASNPNRDPRARTSGMFSIATLPSIYGPEQGRRVVIANMAAYIDPAFRTAYADTVRLQPYVNTVTKEDFLMRYPVSDTGHMICKDTLWLTTRPNLDMYPSEIIPDMIQNITDLRAANLPAHPYFYDYPVDPSTGDTVFTAPSWPLPENFHYTDNLKGSDGLPLGDLNWFPADKATFMANRDAYVAGVEGLAGKKVIFNVDTSLEAENGTLAGTASVENVSGFVYYHFTTGGDIKWTFDLPSAVANCKLRVYTNMDNQTVRGEFLSVNGVNLTNNWGYGEWNYVSPPLARNDWDSVTITRDSVKVQDDPTGLATQQAAFDLPSGTNTIEIKKSWGYQFFSGVTILDASGNVVKVLTIPDAVYSGGDLTVEGAVWAPSMLRYVTMGTGGTITWNVNPAASGSYSVRVFYQNYTGSASAQIKVDNSTVISALQLPSNTDSTGLDAFSAASFNLTAGAHTISMSGASGVNVDYIQLIERVTSVSDRGRLPNSYVLEQNYPNPFNPSTYIDYSIARKGLVTLTVYNVLGQKVATLFSGIQAAGSYKVNFDASRFASGVYFYRLQAGDFSMTKKMMLLK